MEIKENEFVRTDNGIFKVTKIDGLYIYLDKQYFDNQYQTMRDVTFKERIVNHSFNIIDLIELGDFVNGIKVNDISNIQGLNKTIQKCLLVNIGDGYDIINEEIKTVLTKEQYERDCYKIN